MELEKGLSLDIVIVNWNSGPYLEKCIRSIYENTRRVDFKIVVVDNNSSDGSAACLPIGGNELIVRSNTNLGFAKACNLGAKKSNADFLLFLNPDTIIKSSSIESALDCLIVSPEKGIVGIRHESEEGKTIPSCSRFLKLRFLINDVTGLSKVFGRRLKPATIMTDWDHNDSRVVDQVMGSFMLMRRSDFEFLGGFDEKFFVYFEDMDIARRIVNIGKYSYYLNSVSIIHSGCVSSNQVKSKRLFYSLSGRIKYSRKHHSITETLLITLFSIFPEPITRIFYLFFRGRISDIFNTVTAYFLFTTWLFRGK
jgi:GT2 family glycosyltransferase